VRSVSTFVLRKGVTMRRFSNKRNLRIESLESRCMMAVLSVGSGDGSVFVDVDGYGAFGRDQSGSVAFGDANIDLMDGGTVGTVFESGVAIGAGENRQFFSDGATGSNPGLSGVSVIRSEGNTLATSTFTLSGLTGSLSSVNGLSATLYQKL